MSTRSVRYTQRIRPSAAAERYLLREFSMCRFVWNELVAESKKIHDDAKATDETGIKQVFGFAAQSRYLTNLRDTTRNNETGEAWLKSGSSVAQQQAVRDFAAARTKALKDRLDKSIPPHRKRGLPRFKKRHVALPSLNYTLRGFSLKTLDGTVRLCLPGGIIIPVVWTRNLPSAPKSVRVSQDSLGHWYASFVVETPPSADVLPPLETPTAIGLDWGVSETGTTVSMNLVTGETNLDATFDLPHAEHGKRASKRLATAQRAMARRKPKRGSKPSKHYMDARRSAAKQHKKVARQREDDARKWARKIVQSHDHLAIENFKPQFLAKGRMARKAADGRLASAKKELLWQAEKAGRTVALIHPSYTTTDCSQCGARAKRLPLEQRIYTCKACGIVLSRDKNSAIVMVARSGFMPVDIKVVRLDFAAARGSATESRIPRL